MTSAATATIVKMLETLPEPAQDQVVDHLRLYIEDLQDEIQWDMAFKNKSPRLAAAARKAKQEIAQGMSEPMDRKRL
jgi:hypothetical protein